MTSPDPDTAQVATAHRVLNAVIGRGTVGEAVGIVRSWQRCDAAQALDELTGANPGTGDAGVRVEAARVSAVVDSEAGTDTDRDYGDWA